MSEDQAVQPTPASPVAAAAPATQPIDGDGLARGCREPDSVGIGVPGLTKDVGAVLPSWVQATGRRPTAGTAAVVHDHRRQARTVEGLIVRSHISGEDFPLKPWHTSYDWCFHIRPDPQYRNLLSTSNVADHHGLLECEWETAFFPRWAWPEAGSRAWVVGRWIYDCGHPDKHGYKTEIHPPKAVVSFRSEAVSFGGAKPVRANSAIVYIGRRGGYWTSDINDQDYVFSLPLPPRPSPAAAPRVRIFPRTGDELPVAPQVTPAPAGAPTRLDVRIPLKGVQPHPLEYGVVICGGWSDPTGAEARKIIRARVFAETIFMDANKDTLGRDEWYLYVGINGRTRVYESLSGDSAELVHKVDLDLHPTDSVRISVSGFEADTVHDLMGKSTGVDPEIVSARTTGAQARDAAGRIRDAFGLSINQNDKLSRILVEHRPTDRGTFTQRSPGGGYRIRYTISDRP
jgi:hypothetical protein